MKKKYIAYGALPIVALFLAMAGSVSAYGWFRGANFSPEERVAQHQKMFEKQSELLGIGGEKIKDAWAEGKSFRDLIKESGIDEEVLKTKMQETQKAEMQEFLQNLVTGGVITQEQADRRAATMEARLQNTAPRKRGGGRSMGFLRHGGWIQEKS